MEAATKKYGLFDGRNPDADNPVAGVDAPIERALWLGQPREGNTVGLYWYYPREWADDSWETPRQQAERNLHSRPLRHYEARQEVVRIVDFDQHAQDYWRNLFNEILALKAVNGRRVIDYIRNERYTRNHPGPVPWEKRLSKEMVAWASEALLEFRAETNDACVNNDRVARVTSRSQMREYRRVKQGGC